MVIDQSVFDGLKQGDAAAFETLVETFEGPLFRFFYCETRDRELAEELSAETFARLVCGISRMRGTCDSLPAFVFATARHVQSRHRREPTRRIKPLAAADEIADRSSPEHGVEQTERSRELMQAIEQLAPGVRSAIILRFMEELSIAEIAEALGVPSGTIKSHLHRGKQQLKEILLRTGCEP